MSVRRLRLLLRALACARESVLSASLTCDRYSFQAGDEVVRLNAEFGLENIGSPRAHTPPSSNALEVDPVS